MKALVLEKKASLSLRDIDQQLVVGSDDVRIAIHTVGICGSDVHYYTHGQIGDFVVREPMILGHEASGTVIEVGDKVTHLRVGDRVCMEPGIPDLSSRAAKLGLYNIDPSVRFWATPPIHGVLTPEVVHPAAFTYVLPDNVSFGEGAMVEPFAIGMQSAKKGRIVPGDVAVVIGAGTIGIMTALAALAGGCSRVIISDVSAPKLAIAGSYDGIVPVNVGEASLADAVAKQTRGWGADILFEASGNAGVYRDIFRLVRPGGCIVIVGLPLEPVSLNVSAATAKEVRIETVFRYANVYERALELIASGKVDLKPLISGTYPFDEALAAFERAAAGNPSDVKLQICVAS